MIKSYWGIAYFKCVLYLCPRTQMSNYIYYEQIFRVKPNFITMTKTEIITLLKRKIKEREAESHKDWGNNTCAISNYEYGVAQGIMIGLEVIGMLDKPNNKLRK